MDRRGAGRRSGGVEEWGRRARAFLAALACFLVALPSLAALAAPAANGAPDKVVRDIYKHYLETEPERLVPFDYTAADTTRAYFDVALAKMLVTDGKRGDPRLNFDPFVDGQDFEIDKVSLATTALTPKEATVTARFLNFDEPKLITYKLVMTADGWRIADVQWGGARDSLRTLLAPASR